MNSGFHGPPTAAGQGLCGLNSLDSMEDGP